MSANDPLLRTLEQEALRAQPTHRAGRGTEEVEVACGLGRERPSPLARCPSLAASPEDPQSHPQGPHRLSAT